MDNKTRNIILLGLVAVGAYLVYKSKKSLNTIPIVSGMDVLPIEEKSKPKVIVDEPIRLKDPIVKTIPNRTTKDCQITYYSCTSGSRSEIIEIPLDANCNDYQEVRPNCVNELFSPYNKITPERAKIERGYL
jgi:hypothetical protein